MTNYWMLRTYGKHYDPWQEPVTVGMEEPWLVRPADRKLMKNGDAAMLYLMNPETANRRKGKVIFAFGEIRTGSADAPNRDHQTPASAVRAYGARDARDAKAVTVRYTKILEHPISFLKMANALLEIGRRPRIISNVSPISAVIEGQDWPVIEALHH